jgi:hypothetical protein
VQAIGHAYYEFYKQYPNDFKMLQQSDPMDTDFKGPYVQEISEKQQEIFQTLLGSIQLGMKDNSIQKDINPKTTAFVLSISSAGLMQNVSKYEETLKKNFGIDPAEIILTGFEMMIKSIKNQ